MVYRIQSIFTEWIHFTPLHFTPWHFTPLYFTPLHFAPGDISPQVTFRPRNFSPHFFSPQIHFIPGDISSQVTFHPITLHPRNNSPQVTFHPKWPFTPSLSSFKFDFLALYMRCFNVANLSIDEAAAGESVCNVLARSARTDLHGNVGFLAAFSIADFCMFSTRLYRILLEWLCSPFNFSMNSTPSLRIVVAADLHRPASFLLHSHEFRLLIGPRFSLYSCWFWSMSICLFLIDRVNSAATSWEANCKNAYY